MSEFYDTSKDAFGTRLNEGDKVIYYTGNETRLKEGVITQITDKFVKVKPLGEYNPKEAKLRSGRICMKVEK